MMRTDDGRIDHLQRGVRHSASREPFQDHVPDATVGPPPKLPKDRIPVAEALRQVAPWCAGSHQPKHRVEHAAMIAWRPAAAAMDQERFEVRPLIVGHQSANQGCPPQRAALNQFAILASIGLSTRPRPRCITCYSSGARMPCCASHLLRQQGFPFSHLRSTSRRRDVESDSDVIPIFDSRT